MIRLLKFQDQVTRICALALFCLLAALQMLKGVKDSMALEVGIGQLQWLITGSFILIGALGGLSYYSRFSNRLILFILSWLFLLGFLISNFMKCSATSNYILIGAFSLVLISHFWKSTTSIHRSRNGMQREDRYQSSHGCHGRGRQDRGHAFQEQIHAGAAESTGAADRSDDRRPGTPRLSQRPLDAKFPDRTCP